LNSVDSEFLPAGLLRFIIYTFRLEMSVRLGRILIGDKLDPPAFY
jgi:hypothetical protein